MDHLERIDKRLEDIQTAIAEIRAIYDVQQKRLDRIEGEIWGNGRTGLTSKVNAIMYVVTAVAGMLSLVVANTISVWLGG